MTGRESRTGQYGEVGDSSRLTSSKAMRVSAWTALSTLWPTASLAKIRTSTAKKPSATARSVPYQSSKRKRRERGCPELRGASTTLFLEDIADTAHRMNQPWFALSF